MNKLGLLLCFLLIVNTSAEEKKDMAENIYDIIIKLLKGMSEGEKGSCSKIFEDKKNEILPIVKELINEVKNGKSLSGLVVSYGFRLLAVEDLAAECKAFALLDLFSKFTSKDGIKDIGISIQKNANTIHQYLTEMKSEKELLKKVEKVGKIFALVLNFKVN